MNRKIKHICFDLDGTLIDSFYTIFSATKQALKQLNINDAMSEEDFRIRIGHHFIDIFKDLNINVPDFEPFIKIYKEHYFDFIDQSKLYNGVEETLSNLKQKGLLISLLTTKTQDQAEKIISHFNLHDYFDEIMGRRPGIAVKPDPEPLLEICKFLGVKAEESLMAGDTELDITCGKNAGSLTCATLYGYRTKEILLEQKADHNINSIKELVNIL
jgi:HAD superfamily hydrolase (TIGR01549 family)